MEIASNYMDKALASMTRHSGFPRAVVSIPRAPSSAYYISADPMGRLYTGDTVPAANTLLASASRRGDAEDLSALVQRTANQAPSGQYYVPMCTELPNQADRDYYIALYAAELYRASRSCPV